ncbi:g3051 [Coccomyxa viridis]|uniref:G3051 protein n=1 Tax=Coccomyxa viridis TaxID=1274662 RepID=A0ABP1FP62_9CHLO
MGWLSGPVMAEEGSVAELRASVQDLLDSDPALEVFASDACLKRFLTARGSVAKASQQLRKTLQWRSEYKPHSIKWDEVTDCAQGGRLELLADTDKQKRPIILYRLRAPSREGTTSEEYMRFWVHSLESASKMADEIGSAKSVLVFDMEGYSDPKTIMPSFMTRVDLIRTAQAHYPERLGLAVVCNPPFLFWALWRSVSPFLDPVTKSKISFACKDQEIKGALEPHVSADLLYASLGGTKPDDSYSFDRLDNLMRSLDKKRFAELEAAQLLEAKAAKADGEVVADAKPLPAAVTIA